MKKNFIERIIGRKLFQYLVRFLKEGGKIEVEGKVYSAKKYEEE